MSVLIQIIGPKKKKHNFHQQNWRTPRRFHCLDFTGGLVYTTEFLGGPKWVAGAGTHMDKKRLDYYKKKLLARREELTKTIARTQEEGRTADEDPTVDLADKASNSYTKEFLFGMTNTDRTILNMIDAARQIPNREHGTTPENSITPGYTSSLIRT